MTNRPLRGLVAAVTGLIFGLVATSAFAAPKVVASIKPVRSLVAGVMGELGEPELLIENAGSPHAYSLRPSEARMLSEAEVVFWVGPDLERFLEKPLAALAGEARVVTLAEADGIERLAARAGGAWDEHPAEEHEHEDGHDTYDSHLWLDPENAAAIVRAAVTALGEADPVNAETYAANGARVLARLEAMDADIARTLAPVSAIPYVVFHDGYHYFERHYGLNPVGAITVSPERAPGAKHLAEIRRKILDLHAACVFSEPQFRPALVETVIAGTPARSAVLDPLGAALDPGPDAYFETMRELAASLAACLTPAS